MMSVVSGVASPPGTSEVKAHHHPTSLRRVSGWQETFDFPWLEGHFRRIFRWMTPGLSETWLRKGEKQTSTLCGVLRWMEEIRHQLIGGLSHYLQGFQPSFWWCRISSIHSICHSTASPSAVRVKHNAPWHSQETLLFTIWANKSSLVYGLVYGRVHIYIYIYYQIYGGFLITRNIFDGSFLHQLGCRRTRRRHLFCACATCPGKWILFHHHLQKFLDGCSHPSKKNVSVQYVPVVPHKPVAEVSE